MDLTSICSGCLSNDRNLYNIIEETKLCSFLEEGLNLNDTLRMCWECRGVIKRFLRFIQQVKMAQECLKNGIVLATYSSLSTLTKSCNNVTHTYIHQYSDEDVHVKHENEACHPTFIQCKVDVVKLEPKIELLEPPDTLFLDREPFNEVFSDSDDEPLCKKQKERKNIKIGHFVTRNQPKPRKECLPQGLEVIVLSSQQVEDERKKILEQTAYKEYKYKCVKCAIGFNHGFKYENHMRKHSLSAGSFSCSICNVRFREQKALAAHTRRHKVRWRCLECLATYSRCSVAADHLVKAHNAKLERTCNVCGENLPTVSKLRSHIRNVHKETQTCEICGKTLKDKTSLRTHMIIHRGIKEYICPHCNKGFVFKKAMQIHAATHEPTDPLYCHECDMTFKNQNSYYIHMKYSLKHIDPEKLKYACEDCDKRFSQESRLREHRDAKHLKLTPIRCTVDGCTFACASRPVLRSHIRAIHKKIRSRNYVCHLCGKTYTAKKSLEGHLRSHTGSRPLACNYCSATFSYEAALYNHNKLLHKGNAP